MAFAIFETLLERGYRGYSGVPCSWLRSFFALLEEGALGPNALYIPAVREDSAVAAAAGMHLGGMKTCVLMQNSGLGNALNVLTSLSLVYRIPSLLIVSWRGVRTDAVEHEVMGARLLPLLDAAGISSRLLDPSDPMDGLLECLRLIEERSVPAALVVDREL